MPHPPRTCVINVYTGDWIEHPRANRQHSEIVEGEIGFFRKERELFDCDDPEFFALLALNDASCEAALSICQDILASGYHIRVVLRAAGNGLKTLARDYPPDPHHSMLTEGLPDHFEVKPDEIDFSNGFEAAVRGVEFARTTTPVGPDVKASGAAA